MVSVAGEQKARGREIERKVEKEVLRKTSRVQTGQPCEGGGAFHKVAGPGQGYREEENEASLITGVQVSWGLGVRIVW